MVSLTRSMSPELPGPNGRVIAVACVLLAGGLVLVAADHGWRQGALYLTGGALGIALYHAAFGFTSAWRALLTRGDGAGLRAQMVMLAITSAIFLPVLAQGTFFGRPVGGAVADAGTTVAVGAFLFGVGMQLGGGCASGTLFAAGGGSTRTVVTLIFFIAGSVIATAHAPWWYARPGFGEISILKELGLPGALVFQFAVLAGIYALSILVQRRRIPDEHVVERPAAGLAHRLVRGPWPLVWGAVGLAVLNIVTLALAGHPWSITFAFSVWGAKTLAAVGVDVAAWEFWTWPGPARALKAPLTADVTSVMNIGIMVGALLASGLAGRFAPVFRIPVRPLLAAIIGGLLLGYGARLAFGCNIGAFFSGVASGSLHGWLWLAAALAGNWFGVRLRPVFGLG